jgi:hypothetical protein
MLVMQRLKAVVGQGGAVVVRDRVDYPEGTELELDVHEPIDDLDDEERAALEEAIAEGKADVAAGRTRPAEELIRELRAR